MVSPLARAVDVLTDPDRDLPSTLRTVVVVASQVKSEPLSMWLDHELNGYPAAADVPSYRQMGHLPVRVTFAGLGGLSCSKHLGQMDLPKALRLGQRNLRQSVAERTSLAVGETGMDDGKLGMPLPLAWTTPLRDVGRRGEGPRPG